MAQYFIYKSIQSKQQKRKPHSYAVLCFQLSYTID